MTAPEPSLRKSFTWTLFGNVIFAAALYGILIVLTKLGTKEEVGRFALGSAVATPFVAIANLQLRVLYITDAAESHRFGDYVGLRLLAQPLALTAALLIAIAGYSTEQVLIIALFGLTKGAESFSDLSYAFFQKAERIDLMARSMLLRGPLAMVLFAGAYFATGDLAMAMGGWLIGWIIVLVLFDIPQCLHLSRLRAIGGLRPRWRGAVLRALFWTGLPMGLVMLFLQLRQTIPRTVLERHFGEGDLGIFSALGYVIIAGSTVVLALGQSSIARLSRYHVAGDRRRYSATVRKLVLVGILLGIGGVLMAVLGGEFILTLLYTPEFAAHADVFTWLMISAGFFYVASMLGPAVSAMRRFKIQLLVQGVNAVVMTTLALWLIPIHGMIGAAWSMLGGGIWLAVSHAGIVWRGIRRMAPPAEGAAS